MPRHKTKHPSFRDMPRKFDELCRMHPPRPIHDAVELDNATEIIDTMAGHKLNRDQADYLDVIATLVERYEAEHDPLDDLDVTGAALLRSLMEANDLTTSDVGSLLGVDRSHVSHFLNGKRALTWTNAKTLGERFSLPPAGFMA